MHNGSEVTRNESYCQPCNDRTDPVLDPRRAHGLHSRSAELLPNQLLTAARSIKEAAGAFLETVDSCPHCGGKSFVKNGHRHGKQAYICRSCGKTFVSTTGTVRYWSHQSRAVWEDAISDTLNGISLRKTSQRLGISKDVAFDIRHKVMLALEKDVADMKQPEEEPDPWVSVSDSKDCSSATGAAGAKPDAIKEMDETFEHVRK